MALAFAADLNLFSLERLQAVFLAGERYMEDLTFWNGKSVLVTGHTGFKGSWLCLWLQKLGAKVTGFSLAPHTTPSLFETANVGSGMNSVIGDVRDHDALLKCVSEVKPEIVFHMAAQAIVRDAYADPVKTYSTNILGTVNLLDSVRRVGGIKAVVVITSDKCYENREWFWSYREKSALGGSDPYSSSKACAELVVSAFRKSFFSSETFAEHGMSLATVRAGNVIGGGDWAKDRIVPDVLRGFMKNEPIVVRNPQATRPWQFVLEPLGGYLKVAEALFNDGPACAEAWNFGPLEGGERTVGWVVERLHTLWGLPSQWQLDTRRNPHENTYLKLDSSKARALLGWAPRLTLETTLRWIVDWTRSYEAGEDMRAITEAQIQNFMGLLSKGAPLSKQPECALEDLVC